MKQLPKNPCIHHPLRIEWVKVKRGKKEYGLCRECYLELLEKEKKYSSKDYQLNETKGEE